MQSYQADVYGWMKEAGVDERSRVLMATILGAIAGGVGGWLYMTENGRREAKAAGELLRHEGFTFDIAYTSVLRRAIRTLWIALDALDLMWLPVVHSWRLNERHYGTLLDGALESISGRLDALDDETDARAEDV